MKPTGSTPKELVHLFQVQLKTGSLLSFPLLILAHHRKASVKRAHRLSWPVVHLKPRRPPSSLNLLYSVPHLTISDQISHPSHCNLSRLYLVRKLSGPYLVHRYKMRRVQAVIHRRFPLVSMSKLQQVHPRPPGGSISGCHAPSTTLHQRAYFSRVFLDRNLLEVAAWALTHTNLRFSSFAYWLRGSSGLHCSAQPLKAIFEAS